MSPFRIFVAFAVALTAYEGIAYYSRRREAQRENPDNRADIIRRIRTILEAS